jgi:hypothetical protein
VPEAPEVTVIHEGTPLTVHVQAPGALTAMLPVSALRECDALVGASVAPAHCPASCVTLKLFPATVNVALRAAPTFAAAVRASVPLPVPEEAIVTQVGLPVTVHGHDEGAVTLTVALPPLPVKAWLDGEIVGAGTQALPAWLTASDLVAIETLAPRAAALFDATVIVKLALPLPLKLPLIGATLIHGVGAAATVQVHDDGALSATLDEPPAVLKDRLDGVTVAVAQALPPCVTDSAVPPIFIVIPRPPVEVLFDATVRLTVPLPTPVEPELSVIQEGTFLTCHEQPAACETETSDVPPPYA